MKAKEEETSKMAKDKKELSTGKIIRLLTFLQKTQSEN